MRWSLQMKRVLLPTGVVFVVACRGAVSAPEPRGDQTTVPEYPIVVAQGDSGTERPSRGDAGNAPEDAGALIDAGIVGMPGGGSTAVPNSATSSPGSGIDPTRGMPTPGSNPTPTPTPVVNPDGSLVLSIAGIDYYVHANGTRSIEELLDALPDRMGESFVLMEESRSRHRASIDHPRIIMYGVDARFILSVSDHPEDPLREVAEMAKLDPETGQWLFRALDFTSGEPEMGADDLSCRGCHGDPVRPIWGSYPNWPGAFAGSDEDLSGGQVNSLMQLKAEQANSDRFHRLVFPSDHSIRNNRQLYLPSRSYGYANTAFNSELAVAAADGMTTRMMASPEWENVCYDLLQAQWCGGSIDDLVRLYGRLGLNGPNDFQLAQPIAESTGTGYDTFGWNQGSTGLDDVVAFRVLDRVAATDSALSDTLASVEPKRSDWIAYWFELRGEARREWLAGEFDLYDYDLRPQELIPRARGPLCAYLENR